MPIWTDSAFRCDAEHRPVRVVALDLDAQRDRADLDRISMLGPAAVIVQIPPTPAIGVTSRGWSIWFVSAGATASS